MEGGALVGTKVMQGGKIVGDAAFNNDFFKVIGPNAIKDLNSKLFQIKEEVMDDIKNLKIVKSSK